MSQLLIVRHGQAGFDRDDYDQLSENGHRQAALLGQWLASARHAFAAVACGAQVRHRDTLSGIRRAFEDSGSVLPQAVCIPALNEFDHKDVLAAFVRHAPEHPDVLALGAGRSSDPRAIYRYLRAALTAWADRTLDDVVREPWDSFRSRISGAADELARVAGDGPVLVVTSGGVMSQLAAIALELPDARAVELNLAIRNSAISEFHATEDGLRLSSWNTLPHLAGPEHRALWTYY